MKFDKRPLAILMIAFLLSCTSKPKKKTVESSLKKNAGSIYSKKSVDSMIHIGAISADSLPDATPSQAEERQRLNQKYDQIQIIDSTFISELDTLHFHSKYYCLKNINIVEPKLYDKDARNPQEFTTHPFASDILLVHNRDTVLNTQFKASDFNPFFQDNFGGNLKKYGSMLDLSFSKRNKDKSRIVLVYSISIPATDLGIGLFLIINKDGRYKISERY